jgi:hypothetical protein
MLKLADISNEDIQHGWGGGDSSDTKVARLPYTSAASLVMKKDIIDVHTSSCGVWDALLIAPEILQVHLDQ